MIEISAIVSTYNRAQYLEGLFDSILSQSVSKQKYEVVIINNNCTDNTEEICHKFIKNNPDIKVKYCIETSQGLSYGRNRGIKESTGKLITFLDDDALVTPDFFKEVIIFFNQKPHVNAIGGKILLKYLEKKPNWYNPYLAPLLGYFNIGDKKRMFRNNFFRGSNMSFRRSLFDKHDGFNTALGRIGDKLYSNEEKELYYRLKNSGEEIWYVPSTVVLHLVPVERTYSEFIKRQAIGSGNSQRDQAMIKGKPLYMIMIIREFLKWIATIPLSIYYFFTFRISAASMLLRFRYWVTKGLLIN